jgi:hypothetical protein
LRISSSSMEEVLNISGHEAAMDARMVNGGRKEKRPRRRRELGQWQ